MAFLIHRIDAWGVALVVCLLGLYLHNAVNGSNLLIAAAIALLYIGGYLVNDYFDRFSDASDASKQRTNLFVGHPVKPTTALLLFVSLGFAPLAVYASHGWLGIGMFVICILAMWSYSAPPLRIKTRPGFDLLAHGLFVQTLAYFMCLVLIDAKWSTLDWLVLSVNFFASVSGQVAQQIRDYDNDLKVGDTTFATQWGKPIAIAMLRAVTLTLILLIFGGLVSGILPWYLLPFAFAFLPATIGRLWWPEGSYQYTYRKLTTTFAIVYGAILIGVQLAS